MAAGLCSVLKSIRGSMDSESDSDNEHDVTDDVDPPSWHGSMQHLTSTSESEAGNCSSEIFLCDHCGRSSNKGDNNSSNNSNHSRTSGRPPCPSGRKRGVRPKKRAHFAVDTDNSSDNADKMSDSHEISPCSATFKPISGPSQMVLSTSRRGSFSPREIKHASTTEFHNNTRPNSSFTRSTSLSTSLDRGRQPFKASHELFKLPPSGSSASSSSSGKPALPPRQIQRNHFKLQRRNSMSNEERSKLPLQTNPGKSDIRHVRSASASRDIGNKSCENKKTNFEAKSSQLRVSFSPPKSDAVSSRDGDGFLESSSKDRKNTRELPNYDEAVQRVSLLRWASLQKLPRNSSSSANISLSPSTDLSPTSDFSPTKNFSSGPQTYSPTQSSPVINGNVGDRIRCFEAKAVSFSSGSNISSLTTERQSNSWNPSLSNSMNNTSNTNNRSPYSKDTLNAGISPEINVMTKTLSASNSSINQNEYNNENGSVFRLRRDDSSTLSDDVFAHDDSRENFADISWSPVILSEEKSSQKDAFLSVPPVPPKPSVTSNFLSPHFPPPIHSQKSRHDPNVSSDTRNSERNKVDHNSKSKNNNHNNNNVKNRASGTDDTSSNRNKLNSPGDNNSPSLPNGKRIVLEVLV